MIMPQKVVDRYVSEQGKIRDAAKSSFRRAMENIDWTGGSYSLSKNRNIAINVMVKIVGKYGDAAAANAAEFCDTVSEALETRAILGKMGETADASRIAKSVHYAAGSLFSGDEPDVEAFISRCEVAIDRFVSEATMSTLRESENGTEEVFYERVLGSSESGNCPLCEEMASRGAVWKSDDFIEPHDGCTCEFIPVIGKGSKISSTGKATDGKYADGYVEGSDNKYYSERLGFKKFDDVKSYIYEAKSKEDLYHRYSNLMNEYGRDVMQGQYMSNAFRHMDKRL